MHGRPAWHNPHSAHGAGRLRPGRAGLLGVAGEAPLRGQPGTAASARPRWRRRGHPARPPSPGPGGGDLPREVCGPRARLLLRAPVCSARPASGLGRPGAWGRRGSFSTGARAAGPAPAALPGAGTPSAPLPPLPLASPPSLSVPVPLSPPPPAAPDAPCPVSSLCLRLGLDPGPWGSSGMAPRGPPVPLCPPSRGLWTLWVSGPPPSGLAAASLPAPQPPAPSRSLLHLHCPPDQ